MKIIIIGAGYSGTLLAKALIAERNDVVLIDNDEVRVREAGEQLDCTVMEADGNRLETLEEAGIANADAFVVLTDSDEVNMITCSLVEAVYPDLLKIARVRNYAYYSRSEDLARRRLAHPTMGQGPALGIDHMVNPDVEAAGAIVHAMERGAVGNVVEVGGDYGILTLQVSEGGALDGATVRQLAKLEGWKFLIAYVESGGEAVLPTGETVLRAGDRIGVLSRSEEIPQLLAITGIAQASLRRIVVFGADRIGALVVARQTEHGERSLWSAVFGGKKAPRGREILLIDWDAERCREVAERFTDVRVLCGDITDEDLLREEQVCDCDLIVAASGNPERNLLTAAYLKSRGAGRAIALTTDSAFNGIADKLGVDVAIPLRDTLVDGIMSHLRGRNIQSVHSVCGRMFEIVECDISPDSRVAGKRLQEIPHGSHYVVLLLRNPEDARYDVPRGGTVLRAGAHVVLITPTGDKRILRLFCGKE